ncbi:carbohydrate kinase [Danxiaibacter flavus]|uniref:Carbohydrate kinase n=1 Tax=Danxiaibacter flavus TaxID=3049108 RepID=A0ABV3ZET2_9BACT|nr:carbohydrate kinase [Chitinophagaceae bacterium DXS]
MKVLCIGEALIDMICTDTNTSLSDANNFLKKAGGAPANVAAVIAALGGDVALTAKVGSDPFGKYLIDTLESFGVSTQWMLKDDGHFTTLAFVSLVDEGERDFYFNRGADGWLSVDDIEKIDLSDISVVHFGSATAFLPGLLQKAYTVLLQKAIAEKKFISFDPNYRHLLFKDDQQRFIEQSLHFIECCNFFKMSDEEALLITNTTTLEEAVQVLEKLSDASFAITLGKKGALLAHQGKIVIVHGVPAIAVDTTGAGDAFVGSILFQLHRKSTEEIQNLSAEEWKSIVYNANKAGATTSEHIGAMEAFRHLAV